MSLDPDCWDIVCNDSRMVVEGCDVVELAERYGTPLFVVNEGRLRENCREIKEALKACYPDSACFFSCKTNLTPGILKIIKEEGIGAEIISELEFYIAEKVGVRPDKIIFDGIYKDKSLLRELIRNDVKLINIDHENDIETLNEIAEKFNKKVDVGVRVNTRAGWGKNQFGIDVERCLSVFEKIQRTSSLTPAGLLIHSSPRSTNAGDYVKKAKTLLELCDKLKKGLSIEIKYIDLGGGYGSASVRRFGNIEHLLNLLYGIQVKPPQNKGFVPIQKTIKILSAEIMKICKTKKLDPPTLHLEPGTAIVENTQLLLTKVNNVKKVRNETVIVTDAGRINMGYPLKGEYHEVFVANKINKAREKIYKIVGRVCSPHDWLYKKKLLPEVEIGDTLAIMDTGAYFNSNSNNFSFPRPAIVSIFGGKSRLLREAESCDYLTSLDRV